MNQKQEVRSGSQEKVLEMEGQKWEPKVKGQNGSSKVTTICFCLFLCSKRRRR